jgi:hypothetical protein
MVARHVLPTKLAASLGSVPPSAVRARMSAPGRLYAPAIRSEGCPSLFRWTIRLQSTTKESVMKAIQHRETLEPRQTDRPAAVARHARSASAPRSGVGRGSCVLPRRQVVALPPQVVVRKVDHRPSERRLHASSTTKSSHRAPISSLRSTTPFRRTPVSWSGRSIIVPRNYEVVAPGDDRVASRSDFPAPRHDAVPPDSDVEASMIGPRHQAFASPRSEAARQPAPWIGTQGQGKWVA